MSDRLGTLLAAASRLAACLQRVREAVQIRCRIVCREYWRLWRCLPLLATAFSSTLAAHRGCRPAWHLLQN